MRFFITVLEGSSGVKEDGSFGYSSMMRFIRDTQAEAEKCQADHLKRNPAAKITLEKIE